jgi:hypothetical protein
LAEDAEVLEDEPGGRFRRLRRARRIGGGVALALVLALGGVWLARKPIADRFIAGELARRHVQGRYDVTRIGPRTQRLENLVIGNPEQPDLTARLVEVDVGWGLSGARISRVKASGVRLRGRLVDGALDLGQIDRLLEGGGGEAALPDWIVEVEDARADIATGNGHVQFALEGRGPVRSSFAGTLSVASAGLQFGDCRLERTIAPLDIATEDAHVLVKGPVSTPMLVCEDQRFALAAPKLDLNLRGDLALNDVSGAVTLYADQAEQATRRLEQVSGLLTFKGKADDLRGSASLSATHMSVDGVETDAAKIGGNYALRPTGRDKGVAWQGTATVENARPARGLDMAALVRAASGTPLEPLAAKLAGAVTGIGRANRVTASGKLNAIGARGNATLDRLELSSANGARIRSADGTALRLRWPDGALQASGTIEMAGGGLPEGRIVFAKDDRGSVRGTATFAAYAHRTARLGLTPVAFAIDAKGRGEVRTVVTLDGPLPDGALRGLNVPIDARFGPDGTVELAGDCAPVRWASFRLSSLSLDPATVRLCGISDGNMRIGTLALNGRLGGSPMRFTAASAHYALGAGTFELATPDLRIGAMESPVRLSASRLEGTSSATGGGLAGTFEDGAGRIGSVPLDLTEMAGRWRFANGQLDVDGSLRVADTQRATRFNPLLGQGVHLALANGRIDATGTLVHPGRQAQVATVTIRHDLSSAAGQADLKLGRLRFGNNLQPDDLTPLALGVVANVDGVVEGQGRIRWTGTTVTSDGTFSTRDMALAAAFGPVTGLSTTIRFADLLGMRTEPGQVATVKSINPGIEVNDGTIRYSLRSNEQALIEGGLWPFSGGTLELLPAILDLDARKPRLLTFRVVSLDAGSFINTLELENVSATGTFDGLLPMVFDASGGRIDGGILVARQQGNAPLVLNTTLGLSVPCDPTRQSGNLAYVGEVSNAQLGVYGKLAFDALKNLRYRCLAIMLDGALDGEFVTRITINGVNQGTEEARRSFISRPFLGLPFIFNVRIEAPFRGLLNSAASFSDPSKLISGELGDKYAPVITDNGTLAVQPADSEKTIEGDRK